ncbi:hypothetical protein ILUMI_22466 [Ignelater luminosus]|uniref:Uncharacterized protein n=1 Tax=Ignelater luminosus TaxID=2038154 RepID=A0A8K0CDV1_IGNLU|nr:hypothetical protein ILUMI_22466 [Ignelater luminosus]
MYIPLHCVATEIIDRVQDIVLISRRLKLEEIVLDDWNEDPKLQWLKEIIKEQQDRRNIECQGMRLPQQRGRLQATAAIDITHMNPAFPYGNVYKY